MLRILIISSFVFLSSLSGQTVSDIPISFVPRFDLSGSDFENTFNVISKAEDRVVLSEVDVARLRYAHDSYITPPEKQMVMFLGYRNIGGRTEKNVSTLHGLFAAIDSFELKKTQNGSVSMLSVRLKT